MGLKEAVEKSSKKYGKPLSTFELRYDAPQAQLEPIYYWLLDFISDMGFEVQKVTDNFMSSPGSGHFTEMGARATRMQEEGTKILANINTVIKSVLNLIYDLKEFEIRLKNYEDAKSSDKTKKESALLALKQIWLDNVDLKRGRGSIHQMSAELGYTTLREAFLIANSVEDVEKMAKDDGILNEQVKRVVLPRVGEFLAWLDYSEKELNKRFAIEKSYLKTQVETLKLYTSWARPYLKASEQLRQKGFEKDPALVNAFSTSRFNLVFLARKKVKTPAHIKDYNFKRDYYSCVAISFDYRGHIAQRATQRGDFAFGGNGKVKINFDSYCLNQDELKLMEKELEKESIEEGLNLAAEVTETSLEQLKEDIEHFLEDDKKEEKKKEKEQDDTNPFSALFSLFKFEKSKKDKKEISNLKDLKKDNYFEQVLRKEGSTSAKSSMYTVYDIYKKAHGMASSPENFENENE